MLGCLTLILLPAVVLTCDMMNQWHAQAHVSYSRRNSTGSEEQLEIMQEFDVDVQKEMIFVNQNITDSDGNSFSQKGYFNYKTKRQHFETGTYCSITTITEKSIWSVLKTAPALAHSYIGSGSDQESVTMYGFDNGISSYYVTATDDDCIPVVMQVKGPVAGGGNYRMTVQIFGVEPGVADVSIFNLPSNCAQ